ncbi:hypothetical protein AVEN_21250-1 [Araneus ventricosus]|uniref:Uncharacterized protein n=1 Tax=Araneus ventricosus TaxID=182803 RepID=A0A4Y2GG55_ARAVE|nr:hypothetical protein AVEN_21250-1 [Araneus ventricosus]
MEEIHHEILQRQSKQIHRGAGGGGLFSTACSPAKASDVFNNVHPLEFGWPMEVSKSQKVFPGTQAATLEAWGVALSLWHCPKSVRNAQWDMNERRSVRQNVGT